MPWLRYRQEESILAKDRKAHAIIKELFKYLYDQVYYVDLPLPLCAQVWQPWVKNFHGEANLNWGRNWYYFTWIDQDLKQTIVGTR